MRSSHRTARRLAAASAVALLAAACAPGVSAPAAPAPDGGDQARFDATIYAAAVYRAQDVLPLRPAVPDADGRVRGTTASPSCG